MQSGQHGKRVKGALEHAFNAVRAELVAENSERALSQLRAMEQKGLFPAERQWELHEFMGQILFSLSDLKAALPHLQLAWELPRSDHAARLAALSNYLMDLHYVDGISDEELYAEHRMYGTMIGDLLQFSHAKRRREKLRIGYLTPSLTDHIVLNFAIQLFAAYDRSCFEVYLYDLGRQQSDVMEWVAGMTDHYHCFAQAAAENAARRIYADGIDILFDLAGHTAGGKTLQVAAYKPAPVQISGIGYFASTGLRTVDYFLADPVLAAGTAEEGFTEELLVLPHSHFCWQPLHAAPALAHEPAEGRGVVFGSFNNFTKLSDTVLCTWAEILRRVPESRLLLKTDVFSYPDAREEALRRIMAAGIPSERVETEGTSQGYLAAYNRVDIALDPFPYPGGGTTCDALYMGVPVVTLAGESLGSRFGASLLENIGAGALIAHTEEEYIALAAALAGDPATIDALHAGLRGMMENSPVMDAAGYGSDVGTAYEAVWAFYMAKETAGGSR